MLAPPLSRRNHLAIGLLGLGQTVAWAGLAYIFAALLLTWERELSWPKTGLTLALTLAILASGLAAPIAGRLIERGHGPVLLGLGTLTGGCLLTLTTQAQSLATFQLLWTLIGLCHAAALYEPCFALISRTLGKDSRRAITAITLIAGFASALSFTAANLIADAYDWQSAVYSFAALTCLIAAPASYAGARLLTREASSTATPPNPAARIHDPPARRKTFLLLATGFAMMALCHGMILAHLLPLLADRQLSDATAIAVASLIGPMQVAGRLAMTLIASKAPSIAITKAAYAAAGLAAFLLILCHFATWIAFLAVALLGAGFGLTSIMRPVLSQELLGAERIASQLGWLALPYQLAFATAPFLGALLWQIGGYDTMLATASCAACLGFLLIDRAARGG